ncbi:glycine oxidase ThiO [Paenibacillus sp. 1011MAR3C5]|uniref:glycine oxidase ThiO n=1 Tax=Paenibacillus sp. 1011MAR3C5 TaxID=1675787 RepID=UPI000E6C28BE|nr:glycine oxidase ThiO [Paenibacillus sp. 1011MAR3C5]RJE84655.1 glycine oxidase ThiO [Paenibacillus sp. 1011MAR3C5]
MPQSVIMLGGGIIGLSCAFEAALRGYRVIVLEAGNFGGQASGAAAGMLAPYSENTDQPDAFFRLCLQSLNLYKPWVEKVEAYSGMSTDWVRSGSLNVFRHEADLFPLWSRIRWHNEWGAKAELVEGAALRELEPGLSHEITAALYCPEESHIYAPGLVAALETACRKLGVKLYDYAGELLDLAFHEASGVTVRMAGIPAISADRIVICSGAWSGALERWLNISLPIHPIRGQICSYESMPDDLRHMIFSSQAYWVNKPMGRIVCGASEDVAGFDSSVTDRGIERLIRASERWLPHLTDKNTAHRWAGLRPATMDGLPLIGSVEGKPSAIMASGHYRNGILLSPVTAMLACDLLDGRTESSLITAFSPNRFTALRSV